MTRFLRSMRCRFSVRRGRARSRCAARCRRRRLPRTFSSAIRNTRARRISSSTRSTIPTMPSSRCPRPAPTRRSPRPPPTRCTCRRISSFSSGCGTTSWRRTLWRTRPQWIWRRRRTCRAGARTFTRCRGSSMPTCNRAMLPTPRRRWPRRKRWPTRTRARACATATRQ